jgi:hypothetical protein
MTLSAVSALVINRERFVCTVGSLADRSGDVNDRSDYDRLSTFACWRSAH